MARCRIHGSESGSSDGVTNVFGSVLNVDPHRKIGEALHEGFSERYGIDAVVRLEADSHSAYIDLRDFTSGSVCEPIEGAMNSCDGVNRRRDVNNDLDGVISVSAHRVAPLISRSTLRREQYCFNRFKKEPARQPSSRLSLK